MEDVYKITPLLAAIWEDHVSCVDLLIKMVRQLYTFIQMSSV